MLARGTAQVSPGPCCGDATWPRHGSRLRCRTPAPRWGCGSRLSPGKLTAHRAPGSHPGPSWLPAASWHCPAPGAHARLCRCQPSSVPPPSPSGCHTSPGTHLWAGSPSQSIAFLPEGGEGTMRRNLGGEKSFLQQPNTPLCPPRGPGLGWLGTGGDRARKAGRCTQGPASRTGTTAPGSPSSVPLEHQHPPLPLLPPGPAVTPTSPLPAAPPGNGMGLPLPCSALCHHWLCWRGQHRGGTETPPPAHSTGRVPAQASRGPPPPPAPAQCSGLGFHLPAPLSSPLPVSCLHFLLPPSALHVDEPHAGAHPYRSPAVN